jgi:anaerobic magnesium-protoporphyrin IX monomethyl ester cyclase
MVEKRVLLVNLPFYRLLGSRYNCNSLGIAYIASVLNQSGHNCYLYNADYVNERSFINLKQIFEQFHDYKKYFENENHEIWEETINNILEFNPDFVGFTLYTANLTSCKIVSRKLKEKAPHIKQVVGGPMSTMDSELLYKLPDVDYQCKREGEYAMLDLVNGKDPKTIPGIVSRTRFGTLNDNGDAPPIKNLDELPYPERFKFWGIPEEERKYVDVSYVVTIRGCPYRCNYCASPEHWKRNKTQYRSPESVLGELKYLKERHWNTQKEYDYSASNNIDSKDKLLIKDNTIVYFVDDVFTIKKDRVSKILQGMIEQNLQMPFKAEMRTDHLDHEICKLLKEAGCARAKIGIETGSPRLLKQIQKDETREEIIDGIFDVRLSRRNRRRFRPNNISCQRNRGRLL